MNFNHRVQGLADLRSIRLLLPLFAGNRRRLLLLAVSSAIASVSVLLMFFLVGRAVGALSHQTLSHMRPLILSGTVLVSGLIGAGAGQLQTLIAASLGEEVTADLQARIFQRRVADSLPNITVSPTGRVVNSILHDVPLVAPFFLNALGAAVGAVVSVLAVAVAVSWSDGRLLGLFVLLLGLVWPFRAVQRRMRAAAIQKIGAMSGLQVFLEQHLVLAGVKFTRNLGLGRPVKTQYTGRVASLGAANASMLRATGLSAALSTVSYAAFLMVVTALVTVTSLGQGLGTSGLVVVVLSTPLVVSAFQTYSVVGYWISTAAAIVEVLDLHGTPPLVALEPQVHGIAARERCQAVVAMRDVYYRYTPSRAGVAGRDVLQGVTLEVRDGEFLAIVGEVGSGKSTLALLLAGLLSCTSGTIHVTPSTGAYPDRLACLVDNQDFLFSTTIAENLRMVDPSLALRQMVRICEAVGVHRHIMALPQGYNSVVGERGLRLSSGQRQLLTLARAAAARPTVLILDEATTCLDAEAERTALAGLRRIHAGPLILIAHRMSSVLLADRTVVLGDGKVLESGTHEELLGCSEAYRAFYQLQRI